MDKAILLSDAKRQRLGLARAILRKPVLLNLGETKCARLKEQKGHISKNLHRLKGKMTIVVIAHSLPIVKNGE